MEVQTHSEPKAQAAAPAKESQNTLKLKYWMENYQQVIELEAVLKTVLNENEIKQNQYLVLKVLEGGWVPFKAAFGLQKVFDQDV